MTTPAPDDTPLPLPALDGRTPLGFLAALGILHLLTDHLAGTAPAPRIAWSRTDATALLHDGPRSIHDLTAILTQIMQSIPDDGVLPGVRPDLPPPGEAPDRLRLPRPQLREYARHVWESDGEAGERWLATLVTDLSLDDKHRADISLFTAPSGKQSMRTMLEKSLRLVRKNPTLLREAVSGWRRYPGVSGEYLDHRVLFDAVDAPDGRPAERGVPGATWLALMSYPLLRTSATAGRALSSGWQNLGPGTSNRRFIWPLWFQPLDIHATRILLTHPVLASADPGQPPAPAQALSIFWIGHAERRRIPGRTFAGVLTPTTAAPHPRPPRLQGPGRPRP